MTVALGRWAERAACRRYLADWWHSDDPFERQEAAGVCVECPVQRECLAYARGWYDNAEPTQPHGTWGGVLFGSPDAIRTGLVPPPTGKRRARDAGNAPGPLLCTDSSGTITGQSRNKWRPPAGTEGLLTQPTTTEGQRP